MTTTNTSLENRIITLPDWWKLQQQNAQTSTSMTIPVLDLRSCEKYQERMLCSPVPPPRTSANPQCDDHEKEEEEKECSSPKLVVVSIPMTEIKKRSFELPARHIQFNILIKRTDLEHADSFLCGGGGGGGGGRGGGNNDRNTNKIKRQRRRSQNPWKVVHVLIDNEEFWTQAERMGMISLINKREEKKNRKKSDNDVNVTGHGHGIDDFSCNQEAVAVPPIVVIQKQQENDNDNDNSKRRRIIEQKPEDSSVIDITTTTRCSSKNNNSCCRNNNPITSSKIPFINSHRFVPLNRLWQPDPMVEKVLFPLLVARKKKQHQQHNNNGNNNQRRRELKQQQVVFDLASGSARDVTFLAEELLAVDKPYQIIAVDHRYNEKETNIVNEFWDRRGISTVTKSVKMDLSSWTKDSLKTEIMDAMVAAMDLSQNLNNKSQQQNQENNNNGNTIIAALYCVRFWKLGLVKAIANCTSIPSETLFAISHFCKPSVGASWNFDHPNEKTVLERNELQNIFIMSHQQRDDDNNDDDDKNNNYSRWEVLHDDIVLDSDHGRTMIHFVARRK